MAEPILKITRRRLPHWTLDGSVYFITFRVLEGEMKPSERTVALQHLKDGDGRFYTLFAAVVMPDHAHLLLRPQSGYSLPRIMKGTKGVSGYKINRLRKRRGMFWQDESFDRIVRDADEFEQKLNYIAQNPFRAGLCEEDEEYPWSYFRVD